MRFDGAMQRWTLSLNIYIMYSWFNDSWDKFKEESPFQTKAVVCNYFEKTLLPVFQQSSSIWVSKSTGVVNPHNGITNNSSESMNAVLHRLQNWKQVPLDIICYSLFQMCCYYQREIVRGLHQCGSWELKDEFAFCERDPSLMPLLPKVINPREIVAKAKGDIAFHLNDSNDAENENEDDSAIDKLMNKAPNSQLGLAYQAIQNKQLSLVQSGCWMVTGTVQMALLLMQSDCILRRVALVLLLVHAIIFLHAR